jgi:lactate permease
MAVSRISPLRGLKVFKATFSQLVFALTTLAMVVGIGYLANYSGLSYTLGLACASYARRAFPLLSPAIGWLGVFLTGSVTSSAALFGKLQEVSASQLGNGGVAAKLISPQSITIACAAVRLAGRETDIFRKTIKYSLTLLGFVVIIVLLEAWVIPGVVPVDPGAATQHIASVR